MNHWKVIEGLHTHTSLSGGKYRVDFQKNTYDDFLSTYLSVYKSGKELHLTERVPNGSFRFFMDLDFPLKQTSTLPWDLYRNVKQAVISALQGKVSEFWMTVRLQKIHLHLPNLIVNHDTALIVFERIKSEIIKTLELSENEQEIFDKSVYRSGLRMFGSVKPLHRKGKRDPDWLSHEHREYQVICSEVIDENTPVYYLRQLPEDQALSILKRLSLFNLEGLDESQLSFLDNTIVRGVAKKKRGGVAVVQNPTSNDNITLPADIQKVIKDLIVKEYSQTPNMIKSIQVRDSYILVELNNLYCWFVEREHQSNRQYITLSDIKVSQKCHDVECLGKEHNPIKFEDLSATVKKAIKQTLHPEETLDPVLVEAAEKEAKENLSNYVQEQNLPLVMSFNHDDKMITGRMESYHCPKCNGFVRGSTLTRDTSIGQFMSCENPECGWRMPKDVDFLWAVSKKYENVQKLYIQLQLIVNNNTVNNFYGGDASDIDISFDEQYTIFEDPQLNSLVYRALDGTSTHLVDLFHFLTKDRFRYVAAAGKFPWYEFVSPRWLRREEGVFDYIPTVLIDKLQTVKDYYQKQRPDGQVKQRQIAKICTIIKSILEAKKHTIETDAAPKFAERGFLQLLDSKRHVLGFEDGVYDFNEKQFREGRPDDYVTLSTRYPFPRKSDLVIRADIFRFFEDIQPNPIEREYLLTFLSTMIHGNNKEEIFTVFTGTTRNGKSLLNDLQKATLGEYHTDIAANMLTKERPPPSQPQSDIIHLKGKRAAIGSEPEGGQKINSGYMRYITGNDTIIARGLYESAVTEFKPHFKLVLLCNSIPLMDSTDEAVWARSRIVNFPTTFVDNPTLPHERRIDRTLKERVMNWGSEFMLMLIEQYHRVYEVEGLQPTPAVLQKTLEYKEESNIYLQWVNERVETTDARDDGITSAEMLEDFQTWSGSRNITSKALNKELRKLGFDIGSNRLSRYPDKVSCTLGRKLKH